jgi:hypothetical protein
VVTGYRRLVLAQRLLRLGQVVVKLRIVGIQRDRGSVTFDGRCRPALLARDVAEDVQDADIVAADAKHAAEQRLRFGQAARSEVLFGEI